ncbi:site-specific integrase [Micromonospora chalcea]|uniref:site-specific integrase n=1 Tax=Micromonospora chalcea TaxID=1874 RepID=UPI00345564D1
MNRRHPTYRGVYQRCTDTCPTDRCRTHRWAYTAETAAGPDGKRTRYAKGGYATAKDARDARNEILHAHRAGEAVAGRARTFSEWSAEWLDAKVERGELRPSTARSYRDLLKNHLVPKIGKVKLTELRGEHLTRAYAETATVTSPSTVRRIHAMVSGCLTSAKRAGVAPRNVAPDAELPKRKPRRVEPWQPEHLGQLLDWLERHDERMLPVVLLTAHSGMRRGEALGLKWDDIDLDTGRVEIRRQRTTIAGKVQVSDETKTDSAARVYWLDESTCAELRRWRAQQHRERLAWGPAWNDGGWVFTLGDGKPLNPDVVSHRFTKAVRAAQLPPARFHDLRHYRAAAFIATGADAAQVAKAMGHVSYSTTVNMYGYLIERKHREMAEAAAALTPWQRKTG